MSRNRIDGLSRREVLKRGGVASGALLTGAVGTVGAAGRGGGANAGTCEYVVPDDYGTIQAAVDAAESGETICVRPGTYAEQVTVDVDVTIRGRTAPTSGNPAVVDGWVSLDAAGAELRRLVVTRTGEFTTPGGFTPDPFGVRVTAGGTTVAENVVRELTDAADNEWGAINGIQVFGEDPLSNVTVRDNTVRDVRKDVIGGVAGVKLQADVAGVDVVGDAVTDLHSSGWVWGVVLAGSAGAGDHPTDVLVEDNALDRLNDGSEYDVFAGANDGRDAAPYPGSALGIDAGATAEDATVRYNDLLAPNGAESKDESTALVATCNWWGEKSGPTHADNPDGEGTWALERGDATVEFTPWLVAPAPSRACTGGTDGNGGKP